MNKKYKELKLVCLISSYTFCCYFDKTLRFIDRCLGQQTSRTVYNDSHLEISITRPCAYSVIQCLIPGWTGCVTVKVHFRDQSSHKKLKELKMVPSCKIIGKIDVAKRHVDGEQVSYQSQGTGSHTMNNTVVYYLNGSESIHVSLKPDMKPEMMIRFHKPVWPDMYLVEHDLYFTFLYDNKEVNEKELAINRLRNLMIAYYMPENLVFLQDIQKLKESLSPLSHESQDLFGRIILAFGILWLSLTIGAFGLGKSKTGLSLFGFVVFVFSRLKYKKRLCDYFTEWLFGSKDDGSESDLSIFSAT